MYFATVPFPDDGSPATAMIVLLTRCVQPQEAYRSVDWKVIFLIFGMLGFGMAIEQSGLAQLIADGLADRVANIVVMTGGMGVKQRRAIAEQLAAIPPEDERVIVATGKYLGEGFDDARLDTLFLALPISWRGTLAQYAGRLHRECDMKREVVIYDYADTAVPVLERMLQRRLSGYAAIGYHVDRGDEQFLALR